MALTRPYLVAVSALVLAACSSTTTEPDRHLEVVLTASASALIRGEALEVIVTVTNHGIGPETIRTHECPEAFIVTTPAGDRVGPGERFCTLPILSRELAPGEHHVFLHTYRGEALRGSLTTPPVLLPPGEFYLSGQVLARGALLQSTPVPLHVHD
jgi:hypothetical protein